MNEPDGIGSSSFRKIKGIRKADSLIHDFAIRWRYWLCLNEYFILALSHNLDKKINESFWLSCLVGQGNTVSK